MQFGGENFDEEVMKWLIMISYSDYLQTSENWIKHPGLINPNLSNRNSTKKDIFQSKLSRGVVSNSEII